MSVYIGDGKKQQFEDKILKLSIFHSKTPCQLFSLFLPELYAGRIYLEAY